MGNMLEALIFYKEREEKKGRQVRSVLTSRALAFEEPYVSLLKRLDTTCLFSFGYPEIEPWTKDYGCDEPFRFEQTVKFAERGINTGMFVMTDVTRSMKDIQDVAKQAIKHHENHPNVGLHWLDARIRHSGQAELIGGAPWDWLSGKSSTIQINSKTYDVVPGRWTVTGNTMLAANYLHPDFRHLVTRGEEFDRNIFFDGVRLCKTHGKTSEYSCGDCFMSNRKVR